ncbi:MAG TPA: beta-ketoacyl synthase N-terminal-like domain-containing protein [Pyrinomonadaceae bacterium]|nr:beta-ketoacyl synthase N-terminal-like domain-containing protein [Pyrinomonadaceae bacterium]
MTIAIKGIGLATAQGNTTDISESSSLRAASELPWTPGKSNISRVCYPAVGIESSLSGVDRWRTLVKKALADVGAAGEIPLLVASCNGSAGERWDEAFDTSELLAGTAWANDELPVFSSSCASGVHALYAARELLTSGAVEEVLVVAADILARSNHENFESLRVLAERPSAPWQSTSTGFILGEAAVVLRLVRAQDDAEQTTLHGPELASDLVEHDGLSTVIEKLSTSDPALILGQGTGPYANDAAELRALAGFIDKQVPIATPLTYFGHTLGASSLLSIALGAVMPSLPKTAEITSDGRPISWLRVGETIVTCRALNGACAATSAGKISHAKTERRKGDWKKSTIPGPLMNSTIKRLAEEAYEQQPDEPPDILILRLEKPLAPQPEAIIGGRLLPSAVLEITPGFASQLIARCWGYSGPALCLVGNVDVDPHGLTDALRESGANVFQVNLRGSGENRAIEWNV